MAKNRLPDPFSFVALKLIRGYQLVVRPLLAGSGACRYVPSCSEYATESIAAYGALRGGWMSLKRVMRCHPFGGHGLDPVP
jgi:putative membrane protein insertion efficiency factor